MKEATDHAPAQHLKSIVRLEVPEVLLLEGGGGPEVVHTAALLLLPLPLLLLRSLRGEELRHEGVVAVVDDVDGGGRDVEDEVVEVDVDPGPVGLGVLAEVHPHVGRLQDRHQRLLPQHGVELVCVAS